MFEKILAAIFRRVSLQMSQVFASFANYFVQIGYNSSVTGSVGAQVILIEEAVILPMETHGRNAEENCHCGR